MHNELELLTPPVGKAVVNVTEFESADGSLISRSPSVALSGTYQEKPIT